MAPAVDQDAAGLAPHLAPTSSAEKRLGTIVAGTYRLMRHIGSGGSSHVFEAEHLRLGKPFAVKLLRPELDANRRTAQRFRREARAIARLKSEHIVSVVDCGELDDGTPYLVTELLQGEDLRSLLAREGSLPARRAVLLIIEACRGLTEVHAAGLVHRDLKPENLFITRRGTGEDWCKVLDFGVAKMDASLSTAEGAIVGTARYMAPEQLADSEAVGPTTDVYALGAILYECASGRTMVSGSTLQEVMYRIMNAEPKPLSELVPTLPRAFTEVIERCTQKSPAARPSSTEELAALLQAIVLIPANGASANPTFNEDEGHTRPAPHAPRRPSLVVATAVLGAALVGWCARGAAQLSANEHQSLLRRSVASAGPARPPPAGESPAASSSPPIPSTVASPSATRHDDQALSPGPTRARVFGPRPVTSPSARTRPISGFDSTNPYAE